MRSIALRHPYLLYCSVHVDTRCATAFLLSIIFIGEKLIFSTGEKRRQAGQRYAHTKQAIWLAIITGILSAISEAIPDSEDALANKN